VKQRLLSGGQMPHGLTESGGHFRAHHVRLRLCRAYRVCHFHTAVWAVVRSRPLPPEYLVTSPARF
jgi:hypothetical protein